MIFKKRDLLRSLPKRGGIFHRRTTNIQYLFIPPVSFFYHVKQFSNSSNGLLGAAAEVCSRKSLIHECTDHSVLISSQKRFQCSQCNTRFDQKRHLRRHEKQHEAPIHQCHQCYRGFSRRDHICTCWLLTLRVRRIGG